MIDARRQIRNALLTICTNVLSTKPEEDEEFPLICYSCVENIDINMAVTRLKWRVAVYCNTLDSLIELENEVNRIMSDNLGYTRVYSTPDDQKKVYDGFYLSRMDYSGQVDKTKMAVIKYSI